MLPASCQEHAAPVPLLWVMESPIKNKINIKHDGIYNGGTSIAALNKKHF
jgi:hypothetical protein